ncbi:hypothetical protein [Enterobacter ludwigii]|uniref:hypothetical protein n=1 Tax=Enterobacter ludwigii TaxID=299767 RepID=UPI001866A0CE|nr:hypothetical protein [Enterobacter ludwigii]
MPYRKTLADYRALILRFHAEVWQRTGEDLQKRQQAQEFIAHAVTLDTGSHLCA